MKPMPPDAEYRAGRDPSACPACGADRRLGPPGPRCPRCGILLAGPDAAHLWDVDQRLDELGRHEAHLLGELRTVNETRVALRDERAHALARLRAATPPAPLLPPPPLPPPPVTVGARPAPSSPPLSPPPVSVGAHPAPSPPPVTGSGAPAMAGTARPAAPFRPPPSGPPPSGPPPPPRPAPAPRPRRPELGLKPLQVFLLSLGGVLLTVAALVFALVAWPRLDDLGRALVLVGFTVLTGGIAAALNRRLPATAEAMFAVSLGFAYIDWYALRRGGVGADLDSDLWWAIGTGLLGLGAIGLAHLTRRHVLRLGGVVGLQASLLLVIGWATTGTAPGPGAWAFAAGAVASLLAVHALSARAPWRPAARAVAVGTGAFELLALVAGLMAVGPEGPDGGYGPGLAAGLSLLAAAVPLIVARWRWDPELPGAAGHGFVGVATVVVVGSVVATLAAVAPEAWLFAAIAGTAGLLAAASRHLPRRLAAGSLAAAVAWLLVPAGVVAAWTVQLATLPRSSLDALGAWTHDLTLGLQALARATRPISGVRLAPDFTDALWPVTTAAALIAVAAASALLPGRRAPLRTAWLGTATAAVAAVVVIVPFAVDLTVGATTAIWLAAGIGLGATAVTLDRRRSGEAPAASIASMMAIGGVLALLLASTLALANEWLTVAALVVIASAAAALAGTTGRAVVRTGLTVTAALAALAVTPVTVAAAGGSLGAIVLAQAVVAAVVLVGAAWLPERVPDRVLMVALAAAATIAAAIVSGDGWATDPWLVVATWLTGAAALAAAAPALAATAWRGAAAGAATAIGLVGVSLVSAALELPAATTALTLTIAGAGLAAGVTAGRGERGAWAPVAAIAWAGAALGLLATPTWWGDQPWTTVAATATVFAATTLAAATTRHEHARTALTAVAGTTGLLVAPLATAALPAGGATVTLVAALTTGAVLAGTAWLLGEGWTRSIVTGVAGVGLLGATLATPTWWPAHPWLVVTIVAIATAATAAASPRLRDAGAHAGLVGSAALGAITAVGLTVAAAEGAPGLIGLALAATAVLIADAALARWPDAAERWLLASIGAVGASVGVAVAVTAWPTDGWAAAATIGLVAGGATVATTCLTATARNVAAGVAAGATVTTAAVATLAAGGSAVTAALVVTPVAGAVLALGAWLPGRRSLWLVELVGGGSLVAAVFASLDRPSTGAAALTLAVPGLAVAGLATERVWYRWAAAATSLGAVWAWLFAGGVAALEAYTVPAAAFALGAGWFARHHVDHEGHEYSWLVYGPGLALGLAPTLWLVLGGDEPVRALLLLGAAVATVVVGVVRRLQAPLAFGGLTLVALAVHALWPVAAQVPQWALLAVAGALLLWLGATFEQRRRQLHHARDTLSHLH